MSAAKQLSRLSYSGLGVYDLGFKGETAGLQDCNELGTVRVNYGKSLVPVSQLHDHQLHEIGALHDVSIPLSDFFAVLACQMVPLPVAGVWACFRTGQRGAWPNDPCLVVKDNNLQHLVLAGLAILGQVVLPFL